MALAGDPSAAIPPGCLGELLSGPIVAGAVGLDIGLYGDTKRAY